MTTSLTLMLFAALVVTFLFIARRERQNERLPFSELAPGRRSHAVCSRCGAERWRCNGCAEIGGGG